MQKMLNSGLSVRQISHLTGHGITTFSHTHSKHRPELQKSFGGRSMKLSTANVEYAHQIICMGKVNNATEAAKTLQDITNTPFSSQTLCRHLKSRGMKPVVKRKCPLLKPHHRLVFGSPVLGPPKDRDWTGPGPIRTGKF